MKSKSGFTIVELLIVIVVIAILAVISIVGYNGVQLRAKLSQYQIAINQYHQALKIYEIETGQKLSQTYTLYSGGINTSGLCMGKITDYPRDTVKNYDAGACYGGGGMGDQTIPAVMDHLQEKAGMTLPPLANMIYGTNTRGLVLNTSDNSLLYWVPGNKCFGTDVSSSPFQGGIHCTRSLN